MELSEIYSNQVKNTNISNISVGLNAPTFERDPNIIKLEKNVIEQLLKISGPDEKEPLKNYTNIKNVSFEDALKELANIKNNS
jgi:hypothetical protein